MFVPIVIPHPPRKEEKENKKTYIPSEYKFSANEVERIIKHFCMDIINSEVLKVSGVQATVEPRFDERGLVFTIRNGSLAQRILINIDNERIRYDKS